MSLSKVRLLIIFGLGVLIISNHPVFSTNNTDNIPNEDVKNNIENISITKQQVKPITKEHTPIVKEQRKIIKQQKQIVKKSFQCDRRQYCSQMKSYEEAKYFLRNCPNTKMDGDQDGIPCERQFKRYD